MQVSLDFEHITVWHFSVWGWGDHIILSLNINISTAAVFLDIEKAFDTTWHSGLLCNSSGLEFSTSFIKLIDSFVTGRKFKVLVEGDLSTPRKIAAGVSQGSILPPVLYSLYINDALPPTHLELILLCSQMIPVFTWQGNTNIVFCANCNTDSLMQIRGVNAGT
jgi:hypothetical protein